MVHCFIDKLAGKEMDAVEPEVVAADATNAGKISEAGSAAAASASDAALNSALRDLDENVE